MSTQVDPAAAGPSAAKLTGSDWAMIGLGAVASLAVLWAARRADPEPHWMRTLAAEADVGVDDSPTAKTLRAAILGTSRRAVERLLGDPQAAALGQRLVSDPTKGQRADADVWYFPLDAAKSAAIAVTFRKGKAVAAEFFRSPRRDG